MKSNEARLLDRVRAAIRTRHYSRRTEKAYVSWIRRFILFHGRRHPRDLGVVAVGVFRHAVLCRRIDQRTSAASSSRVGAAAGGQGGGAHGGYRATAHVSHAAPFVRDTSS